MQTVLFVKRSIPMDETVLAIRSRILRLCGERGISVNRLANLNNPKLMTIKLICDGLGITLGEFFSCDEFDKLEQSIK